ncbi:phase 1 flagellin transcriptional repressor [Salmonella enterica]|uniref:Phase 1 flagellin transcriptional repressor n=1 Tax=Salmonella enterica I TaxID=59201 RepID=A0A3R1AV36_SALET|nr:phase 1 flagellin transcriptional repressor [Salmonella enterica subsp. enterica serovar Dahomey]EAW3045838.1 phase 1 flagellin transcriptional repressor [Salmonella enterica]EBQ9004952.1 phase 1 flagellin transcriptional repressor [Salmonella enterica subsp. enterica serovar Blockley]ECD6161872.1 phase 1 flagellin transcriptional repressor [Salmonella enterica subsp. enterica]ECU7994966.1 phase 1 flagellin transcriptional repressor [Salmonella enterica subsp. enterica serovar Toucra]MML566
MNDITWGREAEQWPRDYSLFARRIQFLRFNSILVRIFNPNGLSLIGYISKFNVNENAIYVSDEPRGKKRVRIELQCISTLEELSENTKHKISIINGEHFNKSNCPASKKDFFSICNKCFKQGVEIRIHMVDERIIEGKTTGVNACQVGVIAKNGNHTQILFDWVDRITSTDFTG